MSACIVTAAAPPKETYRLIAPVAPGTARLAREFVTASLVAAERQPLIENARICVSDAVANVVRHARVPELSVEVTVRAASVIVGVRDDDPGRLPWPAARPHGECGGRGLTLVRRLSHASGIRWVWDELTLVGKQVWFELREGDPEQVVT
ncbi:ATP-binding protein [Streptomyces sp. NPDC053048]|uniref:ATP-binding protein n=1 Tax=Streptomyces sp. NPDC053048 TaxID=3365694 RepID=UPI0037D607B3